LSEKEQQVAVDASDVAGDHITVPTYFVTEDKQSGELSSSRLFAGQNSHIQKEALHHVKDAEKISDVIRQARVDEDGNREWR